MVHAHAKLRRMKILRHVLFLGLGLGLAMPADGSGLPVETKATQATKFEILRNGQVSGLVGLAAGTHFEVVALDGDYVQVRYRSLIGRVPAAHTDLAALAAAMEAMPAAPAAGPTELPAEVVAASHPVPTEIARRLQGKLVRWRGGELQYVGASQLERVRFVAFYYSAGWCGPCRQFTPQLVKTYEKLRAEFPELEVVFVSADRSAGDMRDYMRADRMAWPAVKFDAIQASPDLTRYAGDGIPCLVLVDAGGKVLSDTNRAGNYVGPQVVLEDTWKILRQYRQRNPRPQA